jgi:hypothetical protein
MQAVTNRGQKYNELSMNLFFLLVYTLSNAHLVLTL